MGQALPCHALRAPGGQIHQQNTDVVVRVERVGYGRKSITHGGEGKVAHRAQCVPAQIGLPKWHDVGFHEEIDIEHQEALTRLGYLVHEFQPTAAHRFEAFPG